jgi:two-component system NtrC family sensor kinase
VSVLEVALQLARRRLAQVETLAVIGQLAPGIAHELNTPLGVIISNLTVLAGYGESLTQLALATRAAAAQLRAGDSPTTIADALDAALQAADLDYVLEDLPALTTESTSSANRIAEIVRSIALCAQSDGQRPAPVNVEEALQSALTLTWHELKQRATVERNYAGVPLVMGSAAELARVFVHLLRNAAQAVPERGGVVTVATRYADGGVVVVVADNGEGIPAENLPRVFEPFFTTRPEGVGLGLSLCQEIVARHQATIDIQSGPDKGTAVTVRLAVAPGGAA